MSKPENLYASLSRKAEVNSAKEGEVKAIVSEFISSRSSADKTLKNMKSVFLDAANVPVNEMTKKKKTRKQQLKDRPLNARERRSLKVYDVPRDIRYEWFVPLHELWQGYMKDLYGQGCDSQQFAQKLLKADFHGAIFTVVRSTNPTYVGATGIVVQETLNLFKIATKNNKLKQIPKAGSVFTVTADACQCVFTLYGQQLLCRAAERAAKKFKAKPTIDL